MRHQHQLPDVINTDFRGTDETNRNCLMRLRGGHSGAVVTHSPPTSEVSEPGTLFEKLQYRTLSNCMYMFSLPAKYQLSFDLYSIKSDAPPPPQKKKKKKKKTTKNKKHNNFE